MRHDDLVCAYCSGRVSEGRCRSCRSMRDLHQRQQAQRLQAVLRTALWTAIALLAAVLTALVLQTRIA